MSKYRFSEAADNIYQFLWHEVADRYIEDVKNREDKDIALSVLGYVLRESMKILHPFMPFVTEAIWENIREESDSELLILENYPRA